MQMEKTKPISAHSERKTSGRCLPSRSIRASSDSSVGEDPDNEGDATCSFISKDLGRSDSEEQTGSDEIVGSMVDVVTSTGDFVYCRSQQHLLNSEEGRSEPAENKVQDLKNQKYRRKVR